MSKKHIVQQGEGISSIAFAYGLKPETIWEHPENESLRAARADPNILREGDVILLPDLRPDEYKKSTNARHRFRRLGVPAKFRLQLLDGGDVRADLQYRLEVAGRTLEGWTDENGILDVFVPNNAASGKLFLFDEESEEQLDITFGELDPLDQVKGAQQRLNNLGFDCGATDGNLGPKTEAALKEFQTEANLPPTGKLDEATKKALLHIQDTNALFPEENFADLSS